MNWHRFDKEKGNRQRLPLERRYVLVQTCKQEDLGLPPAVAVGYLRFAAGDVNSPYFVTTGAHLGERFAWCDCLGDDFKAPLWAGVQISTDRYARFYKRI